MSKDSQNNRKIWRYLSIGNTAFAITSGFLSYLGFFGINSGNIDQIIMPEYWTLFFRWAGFIATMTFILFLLKDRQDKADRLYSLEKEVDEFRSLFLKNMLRDRLNDKGLMGSEKKITSQYISAIEADNISYRKTEEGNLLLKFYTKNTEQKGELIIPETFKNQEGISNLIQLQYFSGLQKEKNEEIDNKLENLFASTKELSKSITELEDSALEQLIENRTVIIKKIISDLQPDRKQIFVGDFLNKKDLILSADKIIDKISDEGNTILFLFRNGEDEPFYKIPLKGNINRF